MNLYVLASAGGMCKIGMAKDPAERLRQLVTGHPHKLVLAQSFPVEPHMAAHLERAAHIRLAAHRMQGEWFSVSREDAIAAVEAVINGANPQPWVRQNVCGCCDFYVSSLGQCRRNPPIYSEACGHAYPENVPTDGWCGYWANEDDL